MKEYHTVKTELTDPFFFTEYADSRQAEVSAWGWSQAEQQEFLRMQYQCQQRSYNMQYPDLESRIIYAENSPAGRLLFSPTETGRVLVYIGLLAEYQNQGIGTALIQELQTEMKPGESLRLSVITPVHTTSNTHLSPGRQQGEENHTLTIAEMPLHNHQARASALAANSGNPAGGYWANPGENGKPYGTAALQASTAPALAKSGSSQGHSNMQPYTVINYCIAIAGLYPSRD